MQELLDVIGVIDPFVGLVVAALIAAAGGYIVAVRRFSGRIGSTEASKLWDAATEMRVEYIARIAELKVEVSGLRERMSAVEIKNTVLSDENERLAEQVHHLSDLLEDANSKIEELTSEIVILTGALRESRERVQELEAEKPEEQK
jgi:chromosome segregation ATPase